MIKALVFDLDDTLYNEKDFIESGYQSVSKYISARFGSEQGDVFAAMIETLNKLGRQAVMTEIKKRYTDGTLPIGDMVSVYREHIPKIRLYPGYFDLLGKLSRHYKLGIITDGIPEVQERKVRALKLENLMDCIIYTWKYGEEKQKPHPHSFFLMCESLQIDVSHALYIGDNPLKDCTGAHRAGMKFAQVRASIPPENKLKNGRDGSPEFFIDTLFQLPPILQELN